MNMNEGKLSKEKLDKLIKENYNSNNEETEEEKLLRLVAVVYEAGYWHGWREGMLDEEV